MQNLRGGVCNSRRRQKVSMMPATNVPVPETGDVLEDTKNKIEQFSREKTGFSALHVLTIATIGVSIGLYLAGRKQLAIFIGLWPPTFQALRSKD